MNVQDELDRLTVSARNAQARADQWQAVADQQRKALVLSEAARVEAVRERDALRAAAHALSESATRPVGYDPAYVVLVDRVCLQALRAALRAAEREEHHAA